jgi:hypothetical protein
MTQQHSWLCGRIRRAVTVFTVFAMALGVVGPVIAAETATFAGAVMAPDNSFAQGFTVVFKDTATGQEFRSSPTGPTGEYQVSVPTGARYKLDSVVAPDGTKLPVQNVPPIPVRVAGTSKLDVKFTSIAPAAGAAAPAAVAAGAAATTPAGTPPPAAKSDVASTAPASDEKKKKDGSGVPWWKKPGPIVGMVLGGVALGVIGYELLKDDASPSNPD